jgi:hypothetical protein
MLGALILAATASGGFYTALMERGIEHVQRGDYAQAVQPLQIAAFGFVDDLPNYQKAQIYLAIANEKLGKHDAAQLAVRKAARAEALSPSYRTLALAANIRAEFDKVAGNAWPAGVPPASRGTSRPAEAVAQTAPAPALTAPRDVAPSAGETPARPLASRGTSRPAEAIAQAAPAPTLTASRDVPPSAGGTPARPLAGGGTSRPAEAIAQAAPKPSPTAGETPARPRITAPAAPPRPPVQMSVIAAAARHEPSQAPVAGADIRVRLAAAEGLLNEGRILGARQAYLRLAQTPSLSRAQLLAVAKGLNDTSAWRESSDLYSRLSPFVGGEELHMFAEAVNRYELGDGSAARVFLQRALPALPKTREILLYRGKIGGQP